jgi:DNA-binding NarL/FixJ family response regulator
VRRPEIPTAAKREAAERTASTNGDLAARERVIDATVSCILELGFYRASTNEIARRAGVTWGVIQHYFGTREALMLGLDVLKWIRQQSEVSPIVVILSSSQEEADIATAYRLGANGYLVKPHDVSLLTDIAKSIKDFWLNQNTPPPEPREGMAAESRALASSQSRRTGRVS